MHNEETGLLVEQKDPVALAEAINRILSDDKLKNKLVIGSKKIVNEFSTKNLEHAEFSIREQENGRRGFRKSKVETNRN